MTCPRTPPGRTSNGHYWASGMCIFCATPDPAYSRPALIHLQFPTAVTETLCGETIGGTMATTATIGNTTCTACRAELVQEAAR